MEDNYNYDDFLIDRQNKINKIEESDSNFKENPLWKKYRRQQDIAYMLKSRELEM